MNTPRILTLCLLLLTLPTLPSVGGAPAERAQDIEKLKTEAATLIKEHPDLVKQKEFHPLAKIAFGTDDREKLIERGHIPKPSPWYWSTIPKAIVGVAATIPVHAFLDRLGEKQLSSKIPGFGFYYGFFYCVGAVSSWPKISHMLLASCALPTTAIDYYYTPAKPKTATAPTTVVAPPPLNFLEANAASIAFYGSIAYLTHRRLKLKKQYELQARKLTTEANHLITHPNP
jgi:hypothetical protein